VENPHLLIAAQFVIDLIGISNDREFKNGNLISLRRHERKSAELPNPPFNQIFDGLRGCGISLIEIIVDRIKIGTRSQRIPNPHAW
jgi:hypothetical protein